MGGFATKIAFIVAAFAVFASTSACSPQIGDSCATSTNCDLNNTRVCDLSLPSGYCTIAACEEASCPLDESVCIQFFFEEPRRQQSFCMALCDDDSDCRSDEAYRCLSAADLNAISLDGDQRFCAIPRPSTSM